MSFDNPSDMPDETELRHIREEQEHRAQTERTKASAANDSPSVEQRTKPSVFLSPAELAACVRGTAWLVEGYFEGNTIAALYGDSKAFKSAIALDVGMHVAAGREFYGRRVQQGAVFYIAGEGFGGVVRRKKAWQIGHGVGGQPPMFVTKRAIPLDDEGEAEKLADDIEWCARKMGQRVAMIVVDTLNWNMSGDENSSRDMSKFLRAVDLLKSRFAALVLIVHHTGHASKDRERGSTALPYGIDARYLVTREGEKMFTVMESKKMKDGSEPAPLRFGVKAIDIGIVDNFGNKQTAIAVTAAEATTVIHKTSRTSATGTPKHGDLLKALDSVAKRRDGLPDGVPAGAIVAEAKDVRKEFNRAYKGGEVPSDPDLERRHIACRDQAFNRARNELCNTGVIGASDGYVWRNPSKQAKAA